MSDWTWVVYQSPDDGPEHWRGCDWQGVLLNWYKVKEGFSDGAVEVHITEVPEAVMDEMEARGHDRITLDLPPGQVFFVLPGGARRPFSWDDLILDPHKLQKDDLGRRAAWRSREDHHTYYGTFMSAVPDRKIATLRFDRGDVPPRFAKMNMEIGLVACDEVFFVGPKVAPPPAPAPPPKKN